MNIFWYDHILFGLLGIVIPVMSLQSKWQSEASDIPLVLPPKRHLYFNNMFLLCIGMLLCLTAWHAGENDWALLGFQAVNYSSTVWTSSMLLIILYLSDTVYQYFSYRKDPENLKDMENIIPLSWPEYIHFIPLAIMAGISEEIMFRGYLFHYLMSYFPDIESGPYIVIALISIGFSLSHLYQGWYAVFKIFILSLLFGIIYYFSESLIIVVAIHCGIDLLSGMSGVLLNAPGFPSTDEEE